MQQAFFSCSLGGQSKCDNQNDICMIKSEGVREKTRVYLDYLNRIIWRFIENSSGLKMEKFKLARFWIIVIEVDNYFDNIYDNIMIISHSPTLFLPCKSD